MPPSASTANSLVWAVLAAGVLLALAGLLLARAGLRPRRVGRTPHCPKCDYPLTGLIDREEQDDPTYMATFYETPGEHASDPPPRCPECGTRVSVRTAVRGVRPRRKVRGWVGVVLLLGGLAVVGVAVTGKLKNVDWSRWRPTSWVIDDLRRSDEDWGQRIAWDELSRRMDAGEFSEWQRGNLEDAIVTALPRTDPCFQSLLVGKLAERYPQLSPGTRRRLFDAMLDSMVTPDAAMYSETAQGTLVYLLDRGQLSEEERAHVLDTARVVIAQPGGGPGQLFFIDYLNHRP